MLQEGMAELIDEYQLYQMAQFIRGGTRERFLAGRWVGLPPFGYMDSGCQAPARLPCGRDLSPDAPYLCRHTGQLVFDDRPRERTNGAGRYTAVEVVELIAERYLELDEGCYRIARYLDENGYETARGRWSNNSVYDVLSNPAYGGTAHWALRKHEAAPGEETRFVEGAWQPIFDVETRSRIVRKLDANRYGPKPMGQPTRRKRVYVLSGITTCGHCGGTMAGETKGNGERYMVCSSKRHRGAVCDQRSVRASVLEDQIGLLLKQVEIPNEWRKLAEHFYKKSVEQVVHEQPAEAIERRLARAKRLFVEDELSWDEYLKMRDPLMARLQRSRATPAVPRGLEEARALLGDIGRVWDVAAPAQRAELVRRMLTHVVVLDDGIVEIQPSPDFERLFAIALHSMAIIQSRTRAEGEYGSGGPDLAVY
jgi:hypothetical protein